MKLLRALVLILGTMFVLAAFSCQGGGKEEFPPPGENPTPDPPSGDERAIQAFSGESSLEFLLEQMSFGYRIPGTPSHRKCGDWIAATLTGFGWEVEEQEFTVTIRGNEIPIRNIVARLGWVSGRRDNIVLAAHWDTRPWADQDTGENRNRPVPGANDGASGTAVLLELARLFSETPPLVGVELVFFDGEDYGPETAAMFIGSKYFADRLSTARVNSYRWGLLLDMVGDRDLQIHPEHNSEAVASDLYLEVRAIAEELGLGQHFSGSGTVNILDDHIPLIERGVRVYNLIDFDYPYWHTVEDTEDKVSAESLEAVGRVVAALVYAETIEMEI